MACLLTPPPTPSGKPFIDLPTKLQKVRERLVDSGTYLGATSVCKNITWARFGKAHKAVLVKSSTGDSETDLTASDSSHANSPTSSSDTSSPTSSRASSPTSSLFDPTETEVAVLSIIVEIGQDDFYLTSDGGYRGPSKFIKSLAHVKPSCSGGVPEAEPFNSDYTTAIDNLHWLLSEATTPGFKEKRGVVTKLGNATRIKVRHLLFDVSRYLTSIGNNTDQLLQPNANLDSVTTTDSDHGNNGDADSEKKPVDNDNIQDPSIKKKASNHGKYLYITHSCLALIIIYQTSVTLRIGL